MTHPTIRLACVDCDTEDGDGETLLRAEALGWTGIEAIDEADRADFGVWWDHLGYCPACAARHPDDPILLPAPCWPGDYL
jgi:hypothetical protein